MATETSLASFSLLELKKLHARIVNEINKREQKLKLDVLKRIEQVAKEAGLSVAQLMNGETPVKALKPAGVRKTGGKAKPKYFNPNNVQQTWTGRGRKPDWVVAHLGTGRALEALLINK